MINAVVVTEQGVKPATHAMIVFANKNTVKVPISKAVETVQRLKDTEGNAIDIKLNASPPRQKCNVNQIHKNTIWVSIQGV